MVFKTESAFMQDIGDLKKYYTSISDRTKNSGNNTAAVKWMYMMGVEPTAFRLGEQITLCPTIPLHYIPLRFVSI